MNAPIMHYRCGLYTKCKQLLLKKRNEKDGTKKYSANISNRND